MTVGSTTGATTGTWLLTRAALRRDRVLVLVWLAVLTVTVHASAAATAGLYPTRADRVAAAQAIDATPATVALYGPVLDPGSRGELATTKLTVLYAALAALLVVVLVRRHLRGEEEDGHTELLAGTAVGRGAFLAAAGLEAALVSVAVGVLAAAAAVVGGLPVGGSVLFGAAWTGTGLVALGVTAVACQGSASSRTCLQVAVGVLGAAYVARAVADVGPDAVGWLGWLSPLGWATRLRAWSDPRAWVLLLHLAIAGALLVVAVALRSRRDLGSGVVAPRAGPAAGSRRLGGALGLAWRLHRGALVVWTAGVALVGLVLGAVAPAVGDLLDSAAGRDLLRRLGGSGPLQDALVAAVLPVVALLVTGFGIGVVTAAAADESAGRTAQVLATGVSRRSWFAATTALAVGGTGWLLAVVGTALASGVALQGGSATPAVGRLVGAVLDQAPAVWLVVALALVLHAVGPRSAVAAWGLLGAFLVLGQLGELLSLPAAVVGLSPYTHLPAMPVEAFAAGPVLVLGALTVLLVGAAWWRWRERGIG